MPKSDPNGRTAVYRLYDEADQLLYVGMTGNPDARFGQHSVIKEWWPQVVRREIEWHPTREIAASAEKEAVRREDPRWNVHLREPRRSTGSSNASSPEEDAVLFARFKEAQGVIKATNPVMREAATQALREGATTRQLAELTGLTPQFFSALAKTAGIALPRGPRRS